MPLFQYDCWNCDHSEEMIFVGPSDPEELFDCPKCKGIPGEHPSKMRRVIVSNRTDINLVDSPWIKSISEVVNKNPHTQKREDREFLRSPTRKNYHNWKRANGLRHMDSGEQGLPNKPDYKGRLDRIKGKLKRRMQDGSMKRLDGDRVEIR